MNDSTDELIKRWFEKPDDLAKEFDALPKGTPWGKVPADLRKRLENFYTERRRAWGELMKPIWDEQFALLGIDPSTHDFDDWDVRHIRDAAETARILQDEYGAITKIRIPKRRKGGGRKPAMTVGMSKKMDTLYRRGYNLREIADNIGVSLPTARKEAKKLNLKFS